MERALLGLLGVLGLLPFLTATAAVMGLGVVRSLGAGPLAISTVCLVLLPITGFWALFGRTNGGLVAGLWGWPCLLLFGLPSYFPGEVPDAITTGFSVLGASGGRSIAEAFGRFGSEVAAPIGAIPSAASPLPMAEKPKPECPPPASVSVGDGDQVAIPYEGQGHSLSIPVQFGDVELPMLFDTGASVTTLDSKSLRRIGVEVPADAPEIKLRTANGERTARLVLVPQVWIGGLPVEGVTVGVCEECADERVAGLLGLNVSGQFLVTLDTARKEVVLTVRSARPDRLVDIGPWLDVSARAAIYPDQRVEVTVDAQNAADRPVSSATVGITCAEETFQVTLEDIGPRGHASEKAALPRGTVCDVYKVTLDGGRW